MRLYVDDDIFQLQRHPAGISRLWQLLIPALRKRGAEIIRNPDEAVDASLATYYDFHRRGPTVVMAYDFIAERYVPIGRSDPDAINKRMAISKATAVVSISRWTADDCLRYTGRSSEVAYLGADHISRASFRETNLFQQKYGVFQPYVLMVGRRGLYKNARTLYQAWDISPLAGHIILAVGGEDPNDEERDRIRRGQMLHVHLPDEDMAAAYSGATALVYPSIYEGFGLPIVEAMRCGCPVVCGTGSALDEVTGGNAFICDTLLPLQLATQLHFTLDPSTRAHRALSAREHVEKFTWDNTAETIMRTVEQL